MRVIWVVLVVSWGLIWEGECALQPLVSCLLRPRIHLCVRMWSKPGREYRFLALRNHFCERPAPATVLGFIVKELGRQPWMPFGALRAHAPCNSQPAL